MPRHQPLFRTRPFLFRQPISSWAHFGAIRCENPSRSSIACNCAGRGRVGTLGSSTRCFLVLASRCPLPPRVSSTSFAACRHRHSCVTCAELPASPLVPLLGEERSLSRESLTQRPLLPSRLSSARTCVEAYASLPAFLFREEQELSHCSLRWRPPFSALASRPLGRARKPVRACLPFSFEKNKTLTRSLSAARQSPPPLPKKIRQRFPLPASAEGRTG